MVYGEIEAEDPQQFAFADEDLLLEPPQLLVTLWSCHRGMLHLVCLDNDIAQLLGCLLDFGGEKQASRRDLCQQGTSGG
jgi:hypothetical protein